MLTTREWATVFWLLVIAACATWKPEVRQSFRRVLAAILSPKATFWFALFAAWMACVVAIAAELGGWNPALLKDTLFWAVPGGALFLSSTRAASEPGFFRRRVVAAVGLMAVLEFYLNAVTLDLICELLLQPILVLFMVVSAIAGMNKEFAPAKRLADAILMALVLLLFIPPTMGLVSGWSTIDGKAMVVEFALPIWLTIGALPFVYVLSLVSAYEQAFLHMQLATEDRRVPWRAKLALISKLHLRHRAVHSFAGKWPRELVQATSFREARHAVDEHQRELREQEAAKRREVEDLIRYEGVKGTDSDGRQLDRREFKETARALEWLHAAEMGWHNRGGRYRDDLAEVISETWRRRGLPDEHGIRVRTSDGGQSWFAWRRTPSGWCLAIGASGPPPDKRYFDGPEPPKDFPGRDRAWGEPFKPTLNWPGES